MMTVGKQNQALKSSTRQQAARLSLRLRAEAERLLANSPTAEASEHPIGELLHELEVHQVELEMQNQALREAQDALVASRDRFVDFFEFAPVGYLTLTDRGVISNINLTGASLLGVERRKLLKCPFSRFVIPEDADRWYLHLLEVIKQEEKRDCELLLQRGDGFRFHARLDSLRLIKSGQPPTARIVFTDISARRLLEDDAQRYRRLADDMPLFITAFLSDGTLTYVNDALCKLVGMTRVELTGRCFFDFLRVDDQEMVRARLAHLTPENPTETHEQRYPWYGEAVAEHQWTNRAFFDATGRVVSYQAFGEDITERKRAEEALREQAQFFRLIAENIGDFIAVLDLEGRRLYNSPSYRRFFGATKDLRGTDSFVEIHPEDQERVKQVFRETVETGIGRQTDYRFLAADGSIREMESHGSVIKDSNGRITRVVVVSHDVTERKEMEKKVEQLAFYDPLTKLPNRRLLSDRLNQIMAASARSASYGALMFIDLDNFKPLNDKYGHMVGDSLLIEASARLKTCVREADTVARFGGDEFVVILSELDTDKAESVLQASIVAEKIHRTMAEPYLLTIRHDKKEDTTLQYQCTSSIGVVLFINHQSSQDEILQWADAAMYQAKQAGRNLIRFHVEKA